MIYSLKKHIPRPIVRAYHWVLALMASIIYGNPSKDMIVIGVTGTNGKSTTVNIISSLLESEYIAVGFATTANFKIGDRVWLNDTKMTMLGRFRLQKMLKEMRDAGCHYAVIETSSQGIEQFRHLGIRYDYAVFTNLTPEHIEAHGGFENYKKAKGKLFARLSQLPPKIIQGRRIPKTIVVNLDDEHAEYFLQFPAEVKIGYTLKDRHTAEVDRIYTIRDISLTNMGVNFECEGTRFTSALLGSFNVYNTAAALSVAFEEQVPLEHMQRRLAAIAGVPGRMEFINEGQDFIVLIDYAPEPESLRCVYATLQLFEKKKIIHVLGSCGGGRDVMRRPILGAMAGSTADYVIVTNEDPYDDDPMEIMLSVAQGALDAGKVKDNTLFIIEDRKDAIHKAIELAQPGDIVLITGKGCELYIMGARGAKIPHDDREVARDAIRAKLQQHHG